MLKSNQQIQNFYDFANKLGEGRYGIVKRAISKITGEQYAMKIISKESISMGYLIALRNMWSRLAQVKVSLSEIDHPNVIKLHEVFEDNKNFYLILEFVTGETLYDNILNNNFLNEKEAAQTFRQIVEAIICCHCMGIVHGDLKPETLIFNNSKPEAQIKICDFGLAREQSYITVPNMSLNGKEYTESIDYWSIGALWISTVYDEDYNELFEQIKEGEISFPSPYWDSKSNEAKDVISSLLRIDPSQRLKGEQVLKHDWLSNYQIKQKNNHNFQMIKE